MRAGRQACLAHCCKALASGLPLCPPPPPLKPQPPPTHPPAGFVKLVVTQRWDPRASHPQDSVNFGVTLLGPLKLPVSGALKASYTAAFRRARATAAGARSVVLSAASGQQP